MRRWVPAAAAAALVAAVFVVVPAVAQTSGTIYACIGSGRFTHVNTDSPQPCPSQTPVSWPGDVPGTPSPSPSSMSASPSPSPTATTGSPSPSPSPTVTGGACVTTDPQHNCGPYDYPPDTASSGYNTYVGQDVFNPVPGWSGTLTAYNPGNWTATENMPDGNTSVVGYPSVGQGSTGGNPAQAISAYTQITSTFAEQMNATPSTDAEAAYDVWTAAGDETMIQFDFTALRPRCSAAAGDPVLATVAFTEPGTSTAQDWDFCVYGTERIWQLHGASEQSGAVDILAMLTWEQASGYLPATAQLGLVGFGFEVCSTGGVPEDFTVSQFSLTALPNP